jgi:hypothetical protein
MPQFHKHMAGALLVTATIREMAHNQVTPITHSSAHQHRSNSQASGEISQSFSDLQGSKPSSAQAEVANAKER